MNSFKVFINPSYLVYSERCVEIKINLNFYFHALCGASKDFMNTFKAFMKPYVLKRKVKIKI